MNRRPQRPSSNRNRRVPARQPAGDLWFEPESLADIEPISVAHRPSALLLSLGDPPMLAGAAASLYFATVIERASSIAAALALSADLLVEADD